MDDFVYFVKRMDFVGVVSGKRSEVYFVDYFGDVYGGSSVCYLFVMKRERLVVEIGEKTN